MNSVNLVKLPPSDRATRYRELAEEMRSSAARAATAETYQAYLRMAVEWLDMAERLEAEYGKVSITVQAPELASLIRRRGSP